MVSSMVSPVSGVYFAFLHFLLTHLIHIFIHTHAHTHTFGDSLTPYAAVRVDRCVDLNGCYSRFGVFFLIIIVRIIVILHKVWGNVIIVKHLFSFFKLIWKTSTDWLSERIRCQSCILALCRFKMVVSLKRRFSKQTPLESAAALKARELT